MEHYKLSKQSSCCVLQKMIGFLQWCLDSQVISSFPTAQPGHWRSEFRARWTCKVPVHVVIVSTSKASLYQTQISSQTIFPTFTLDKLTIFPSFIPTKLITIPTTFNLSPALEPPLSTYPISSCPPITPGTPPNFDPLAPTYLYHLSTELFPTLFLLVHRSAWPPLGVSFSKPATPRPFRWISSAHFGGSTCVLVAWPL